MELVAHIAALGGGHEELEELLICAVIALIIGAIAYLVARIAWPGYANVIGLIFFLLALIICIL